ncbi:hypothetical protein PV10_08946 [Exophiala mesophila]|uniref:Cupin type-1 domain-containing protein n=1 Tax=Exophiala mesophila TaxID=212818 RepID=A0A0D1Z3L7_EXOME|nr:uncharacterized protein PV10_08946 [Exophiala mesophila]KIV89372.1 hypothetical protein PV10_08946 [Exophiala mesophila]
MLTKTILIAALTAAVTASPLASVGVPDALTSTGVPDALTQTGVPIPGPESTGFVTSVKSAGTPTATGGILGNPNAQPNKALPSDSTLVSELLNAPSTLKRFEAIQKNLDAGVIDLKFDFNPAANPAITPGAGGQVDLANRVNFPLLTGTGISFAGIFFQPCGLNTPHIHPRATEFLTVATDSNILSGFVLENPLTTEFNTTLTQYQGTVFPQGSIHFQQNLDCKPAVALAGLNSEDPGASSLAQRFLVNIDPQVVDATLGFPNEINADNFKTFKANIPAPLAQGVEECLIRCHIPY